jgi:hypothetical protein
MADRWIVIPGWDKFQHRDAGRSSRGFAWLRDYGDQLNKDEYRALTFHQRGLLKDLRHSYATTKGQLSDSTLALTRRLGHRVLTRDLEALANAGYIVLSASKPPALSQHAAGLEVEGVKETKGRRRKPVDNGEPAPGAQGTRSTTAGVTCPHCGVMRPGPRALADHIDNVHFDLATNPPTLGRSDARAQPRT